MLLLSNSWLFAFSSYHDAVRTDLYGVVPNELRSWGSLTSQSQFPVGRVAFVPAFGTPTCPTASLGATPWSRRISFQVPQGCRILLSQVDSVDCRQERFNSPRFANVMPKASQIPCSARLQPQVIHGAYETHIVRAPHGLLPTPSLQRQAPRAGLEIFAVANSVHALAVHRERRCEAAFSLSAISDTDFASHEAKMSPVLGQGFVPTKTVSSSTPPTRLSAIAIPSSSSDTEVTDVGGFAGLSGRIIK